MDWYRREMILGGALLSVAPLWRPSLHAADFGLREGPGEDSHAALQSLFDAAARRGGGDVVIPRGIYAISRPLALASPGLRDVRVIGEGAELVFTAPRPALNAGLLTITGSRRGGRLEVTGLSLRLDRAAVRTPNCDMLRLRGFGDYLVDGVTIGSADNMALTIGRGDPRGYVPERIVVRDCGIGGRRAPTQHSHASIGDTAIWIVTPAAQTQVTNCVIRETGDDGIYVGHSNAPGIGTTLIRGNSVTMAGARGIVVAVPGAEISGNRIDTTNICGIACEHMDGNNASRARITRNTILRAGQLQAGAMGQQLMTKVHPHGIFIYQPGGGIVCTGNVIEATRGAGVCLYTHAAGDFAGLQLSGGSFARIGVDARGAPQRGSPGVLVRGGAADTICSDVRVTGITVADSQVPLLRWTTSSTRDDRGVDLRDVRLTGCRIGPDDALVRIASRRGGEVHAISVAARAGDSLIPRPLIPPNAKASVRITP